MRFSRITDIRCLKCGHQLIIQSLWRKVNLRCKSCGAEYPIEKFADRVDDIIEEALANIPCNRFWNPDDKDERIFRISVL